MTIEISEREMINRFYESLKEASSKAREFRNSKVSDRPQIFKDFVHLIKVAAGSAHQLFIYRENLRMEKLRDILEKVIEVSQQFVITPVTSPYWIMIEGQLDQMAKFGKESADAKPITRVQLLAELDFKQKNLQDG